MDLMRELELLEVFAASDSVNNVRVELEDAAADGRFEKACSIGLKSGE